MSGNSRIDGFPGTPRFVDAPPMLLAGLRRHHPFATAYSSIVAQWEDWRRLPELPGAVVGVTYGAICGATDDSLEYLSGVEVGDFAALPAGLGRMRVPAQHYAVFTLHGHVSLLPRAWQAIRDEWLPQSGYEPVHGPEFERYDWRFDPGSGTGTMEIWCAVRRRT
ncbi:MAG: AraC family transcriptional regulator [Gammaproteobacteria bacterium]|nr:AraC family transcriptional regulator [Gammaproteobacteria bacterium]